MYFGAGGTTEHPWEIRPSAHETQTKNLEALFQQWLFFGLIIEALDGNLETTSLSHLPTTQQGPFHPVTERHDVSIEGLPVHRHKQTIIDRVYNDFIYVTDGVAYITTKTFLAELHDSWAVSLLSLHTTRNRLEVRCKRMRLCLRQAHYFYTHLPPDFAPQIKFTIGAVAETIAHAMQPVCHWLNIKEFSPNQWGDGYYQHSDVQLRMDHGGWCPSDLARSITKFKFLHTFHYLSFLDKKKPDRSHASCTISHCVARVENTTGRSSQHWKDGCACREVDVNLEQIVRVLRTSNAVPLLAFRDKDQEGKDTELDEEAYSAEANLTIDVLESSGSTPYVAISHIWSDGLGNERANSLNACKLRELRRMVKALPASATTTGSAATDVSPTEDQPECPLIWLDTLCCPVRPKEDKKLSLEKMRQVYEQATCVLVLDAALQSYSTESMDSLEVLARIFTSRWLRRVWTLQEGALAKRLWFQFANMAVSLAEIKATMEAIWPKMLQQKIIFFDIRYEIDRIEQFFQTKGYDGSGSNLKTLDEALLYRGITDPSDEPLCIGTLMDLSAKDIAAPGDTILEILEHKQQLEDAERRQHQHQLRDLRMQVVWKLLAEKLKSLPAEIIFFEEARLAAEGFRWAPQSFLDAQQVYLDPKLRQVRWDDKKPGTLTNKGLQVNYPGFRLYLAQYDDGKPRHPWKGRKRPPEEGIVFRDKSTGEWYSVATKQRARDVRDNSAGAVSSAFPLHDFMHQNGENQEISTGVFLLMAEIDQGETPHAEKNAVDGILTIGAFEQSSTVTGPVIAKSEIQVIVGPLPDALSALYNAAERLALALRAESSTDKLLALSHLNLEEEDYKVALKAVEQRMKDMMALALDEDEFLRMGIRRTWGDDVDEYLWVFIGDWFNHAFLGARLDEDQVWIID